MLVQCQGRVGGGGPARSQAEIGIRRAGFAVPRMHVPADDLLGRGAVVIVMPADDHRLFL